MQPRPDMICPDVQKPHWTALVLPEGLLKRVKLAVPFQLFDGLDLGTVCMEVRVWQTS
jgi:hypothetical protein